MKPVSIFASSGRMELLLRIFTPPKPFVYHFASAMALVEQRSAQDRVIYLTSFFIKSSICWGFAKGISEEVRFCKAQKIVSE